MALLASALEARQRCDVVAVTPAAGRTAVLWIGRTDRLIHRIDVPLSERVETIRYADYRRVGDAALPFSIAVDDGDEAATARIAVSSYRFLSHVRAAAVRPPPQNFTDSRIKDGLIARSSLSIDRGTGFPIVFAAVDGRKPMPFIVDTGGHDILTPIATRHLGLKTVGQGVSFGAGSGSTPTTFTSVRKVAIGRAEMLAQPFTVLDLDLGKVSGSNGRKIPIAGILGLEFFERFTVSLNFPLREVTLLAIQPASIRRYRCPAHVHERRSHCRRAARSPIRIVLPRHWKQRRSYRLITGGFSHLECAYAPCAAGWAVLRSGEWSCFDEPMPSRSSLVQYRSTACQSLSPTPTRVACP